MSVDIVICLPLLVGSKAELQEVQARYLLTNMKGA